MLVGDGEGSLACCSPWGCKESDTTEQLNRTELNSQMGEMLVGRGSFYALLGHTTLPSTNLEALTSSVP